MTSFTIHVRSWMVTGILYFFVSSSSIRARSLALAKRLVTKIILSYPLFVSAIPLTSLRAFVVHASFALKANAHRSRPLLALPT